METGERLAAYLAGELPADEHAAVEAALAADAGLRAHLARIRRIDTGLADLATRDVAPAPDFSARLRAAVDAELATLPLGGVDDDAPVAAAASTRADAPTDELAARRASRGYPRWLLPAAGVAAAAAVLGVVGVGVMTSFTSGDDSGEESAAGLSEESDAAMDAEMAQAPASALTGPVVVAEGASYDADGLTALLDDQRIAELRDLGLDDAGASELAGRYAAALQLAPARTSALTTESAQADDGADAAATFGAAPLQYAGEPPDATTAEAISRCLPPLLQASSGTVVPAYVEVAAFEGEEALVYGLLSRDPDTGTFSRVEVWVVAPADCQVLRFIQG
ncbi:MAG: hypothetical protein ACLGIR_13890 [Actinomycetes bacterium]